MASTLNGKFVWYELTTPATADSRRFYGEVLGWDSRDAQIPNIDYSLMSIGGEDVAGFLGLSDGMQAGWLGYICVDDLDAAFAKAQKDGAAACVPINPIPGVGRFAILADPTGAAFGLLEYAADFAKPTLRSTGIPGHGYWRELHTNDREKAFAFYSGLFGWSEKDRMAMGPDEFYQLFGDETPHGGIFNNPKAKSPHWHFYFRVEDIDAAQARLEKAGGKIVAEAMQVPGGTWVIQAQDPEGTAFALEGTRDTK